MQEEVKEVCDCDCDRVRRKSGDTATWKADQDHAALGDGPRIIVHENGTGNSRGMVQRITSDAREDEMDKNLCDVAQVVSNLRNMAIDMGNECTVQNQKLDRIIEKVSLITLRLCLRLRDFHRCAFRSAANWIVLVRLPCRIIFSCFL